MPHLVHRRGIRAQPQPSRDLSKATHRVGEHVLAANLHSLLFGNRLQELANVLVQDIPALLWIQGRRFRRPAMVPRQIEVEHAPESRADVLAISVTKGSYERFAEASWVP